MPKFKQFSTACLVAKTLPDSSVSLAHSPGAVTLGTLGFQPTIPLAERAAARVLLRLSLT